MPQYEIDKLPDNSVDIFINCASLGEMNPDTCSMFVSEICRTDHSSWHFNHEYTRYEFEDGTRSLVNSEYTVPDEEFDLVTRFMDYASATYKGFFNRGYDYYCYYYTKK